MVKVEVCSKKKSIEGIQVTLRNGFSLNFFGSRKGDCESWSVPDDERIVKITQTISKSGNLSAIEFLTKKGTTRKFGDGNKKDYEKSFTIS